MNQRVYCQLPDDGLNSGQTGLAFHPNGFLYLGADAKYSFYFDGASTQFIRDMGWYSIRGPPDPGEFPAPGTEPGTADVVFSSDGNTLYFSNKNSPCRVYQYSGATTTVIASAPDAPVRAVYGLALSDAYVPVSAPSTVVATIKEAKLLPDGTNISISGKIATTSDSDLPGFFYIEESDRSSGIRVTPLVGGLQRGSVVDVQGMMGTTPAGERQIENAQVTIQSTGDPLGPLGTNNRGLGGSDFGVPPDGQYGVAGAGGLNNIGLLITVWGEITGTDGDYLLIDDGSGVSVRVDTATLSNPPTTGYIGATGISSLYKPGADRLRLVLAIAAQQL